MLPLIELTKTCIAEKAVYVNGYVVINPGFQLFVNDLIQIQFSLNFYMYFKYLINFFLKKMNKLKSMLYKRVRRYGFAFKSYHNKNLLKKIHHERVLFSDIPKYIELDYLTLSFFIVYTPFLFNDFNYFSFYEYKFTSLRMYN